MEVEKLNELLESFNTQAESVKGKLTDLLVIVSDGKAPEKEQLQIFNSEMNSLISGYDELKEEAEKTLAEDELPKSGSRAAEYVYAIINSRSRLIKLQMKKAEDILHRFMKVKSLIEEYESVLMPFKEKAEETLKEISEDNIDTVLKETEGPDLFLQALDPQNIKGPAGFKILGEINKFYPMEIQWGLAQGQYFIDESILSDAATEAPSISSERSEAEGPAEEENADTEEIIIQETTDEATIQEAIESAEVPEEPENVIEDTENNKTDQEKLAETPESSTSEKITSEENNPEKVNPEEISSVDQEAKLIATNKVKTGTPSASSFKKEIMKLARANKEVRDILPLMTNLGVLTKEQLYRFGIVMDCFGESDRDRERIDSAVDALSGKGFLARFDYEEGAVKREAYCLSVYCLGCLKKDSISTQMRGFWGLSLGDVKVTSSSDLDHSIAEKFIRNNEWLSSYLYAVKGLVEPDEYQIVKQSIKWNEDHYRVAVVKDGITTNCQLYDSADIPESISEEGILIVGNGIEVNKFLTEGSQKVFVFDNQTVRVLENSEEESVGSANDETHADSDDIHPNDSQDKTEELTLKEDAESEKTAVKKDKTTEMMEAEVNHDSDPISSLINKTSAPTDAEFCSTIDQLLNRNAVTKEQLTSVIAQTVAFAKAVGDVAKKENGIVKDYENSYLLSSQIRLASNLMLNECAYTSEFLSTAFPDPEKDDSALMLSAYMFAMLVSGMAFDFGMKEQTELFLQDYEKYFGHFTVFKPLFNSLLKVRDVTVTGFSPAFVSLLGDEAEGERFINELRSAAKECMTVKAPKTRMKALPPMYSACFGQGSVLYDCMSIINENKQDAESIEYVTMVLGDYCDDQNGALNLSNVKIEEALNKAWYDANPKNKFKLEYDARDQALRQFSIRLELMQKWVEHINNMLNRQQDISKLKALRAEIIGIIQKIQKDGSWKKQKNANILSWALYYMYLYLNGQVVKLNIYSEFLYTGIITVGYDGIPVIDHDLSHVKYYEPWRNVLAHVVSVKKSLPEIKAEIIGDSLDDKADEEGLKDNLHQLEMLGMLLGDTSGDYVITEGQLKDAVDSADDRATRFQEKLELAYTYNQINETEKENLLGIVNQYKESFYEAQDFACWRRFLEALEKQITEFAMGRKRQLRSRLDTHLKENPESSVLKEADRLLEEDMNLAVTEEYINRYENGESELDDDVIFHDTDYFTDFLEPSHFDPLLQECRRNTGKNLGNFGWNYVERNMPKEWTSRQRDDSKNLVTNWPKRKGTATPLQIKTLFAGLGFDVIDARRTTIKKEEIFQVEVHQMPKSMADYRHPIAAFGTQMKSPINAIVLYGNYTEKQLVDTVSNLDLGGISIVLLDRPVDAASRRLIGEIFHTQTSGQNPFLLIDQVLLLYLALHQITERMPAMLRCTLPYSTYQPFVRDGGSTTDEMFCGRTQELATIIDPNGACVVYGGRQLGKTALLERAESRCSKPENKAFAIYTSIVRTRSEKEVVSTIVTAINNKVDGKFILPDCNNLKELCAAINKLFRSNKISSMLLLIDEVDDFLASIASDAYRPLQPLVDLKRETKNNFKFVIAGLHNVCRAKNATKDNGIFGQLGTPLCVKPLSPTDALQLISRPLRYLGFQIDRYPHLETILTNTNYYPGILQFFGYKLVETLTGQYSKYYRAADGNPPFTLQDEQLGAVMNSSSLNKSIKEKFRLSLDLDQRYFMIARCITMLYHYYEDDRKAGSWQGFSVDAIMEIAKDYDIHCLEKETKKDYINLLDEMVEMGILGKPDETLELYRLRRNSFVDIIGESFDAVEADIESNNGEV